jgi:hypothetical protein
MTRRERRPNGTACTCSPAVGSQLDHVDVPSRQSGPHPRQPAVLAIKNVEDAFARLGYLAFYLAGGLVATMTQAAMTLRFGTASNPRIPNLRAEQSRPFGRRLLLHPSARILTLFMFFRVRVPALFYRGAWFQYQLMEADVGLYSAAATAACGIVRPRRWLPLWRGWSLACYRSSS